METLTNNSMIICGLSERQYNNVNAYIKRISSRGEATLEKQIYQLRKEFGRGIVRVNNLTRTFEFPDQVDIGVIDAIHQITKKQELFL